MRNSEAKVLMITNMKEGIYEEIADSLIKSGYEITFEHDLGTSIHRIQERLFDVIILDTKVKGMEIPKAIRIFKSIDPKVNIIVKTDSTSKNFEAQIRQEKIYYYHINSFDTNDLKLAIKSAIEERRINYAK